MYRYIIMRCIRHAWAFSNDSLIQNYHGQSCRFSFQQLDRFFKTTLHDKHLYLLLTIPDMENVSKLNVHQYQKCFQTKPLFRCMFVKLRTTFNIRSLQPIDQKSSLCIIIIKTKRIYVSQCSLLIPLIPCSVMNIQLKQSLHLTGSCSLIVTKIQFHYFAYIKKIVCQNFKHLQLLVVKKNVKSICNRQKHTQKG